MTSLDARMGGPDRDIPLVDVKDASIVSVQVYDQLDSGVAIHFHDFEDMVQAAKALNAQVEKLVADTVRTSEANTKKQAASLQRLQQLNKDAGR